MSKFTILYACTEPSDLSLFAFDIDQYKVTIDRPTLQYVLALVKDYANIQAHIPSPPVNSLLDGIEILDTGGIRLMLSFFIRRV